MMEALNLLKSSEPPQWLAPSTSLSANAREASSFLFSSINPHVPKCPFDRLLTDGFDAEQIWQQIDIQSQPLLASLSRQIAYFKKNPHEIGKLSESSPEQNAVATATDEPRDDDSEDEKNGIDTELPGFDEGDEEDDIDSEFDEFDDNDKVGLEEGEEDEDEGSMKQDGGIEDKFLKIKELEEYLEDDEAREYGVDKKQKKSDKKVTESDEEDTDNELDVFDEFEDSENEDDDGADAKYEDFFCAKKQNKSGRKSQLKVDLGSEDDSKDEGSNKFSTHEKQLKKVRTEIEKLEKETLEPKSWIMQGEITASKRPVNSALEVDFDFEHNIRQPPVITEEVSVAIEDMIKSRIIEGKFDNINRAVKSAPKATKELKEIDDNKSKKGLAEVYEEEYVQKTNPFASPVSFSNKLKEEASVLFKKLCLQLDALSHFHFAPKPVIEEMAIRTNVPALAMEEIAPVSVSEAAMLAPEEVFSGKGDIKEENELTRTDRKRRRAQKKRKYKAKEASRTAKKTKLSASTSVERGA